MPKRKRPRSRGVPRRQPARTEGPADPFAGLAERVQRAATPIGPRPEDIAALLERRKADGARIDEAKDLLRRAVDALREGHDSDARRAVEDALRIPPIDRGEVGCAGMAAHMMIGDEIEAQAAAATDEQDTGWIDRALAVVPRSEGRETEEIRLAVGAVRDYRLTPAELARVEAVIPDRARFRSPLEAFASPNEQAEALLVLLRTLMRLEDAGSGASSPAGPPEATG